MKHFTTPYFNLIQLLGTLCIFSIVWHCERDTDPSKLTDAQIQSIRVEERLRIERVITDSVIAAIMPDTVIVEIDNKQKADEKHFNNRIIDIVGLDLNGTIEASRRVVSKGDSIRSGHLNLVHPR